MIHLICVIALLLRVNPLKAQDYRLTVIEDRFDYTFMQLQYDQQETTPMTDLVSSLNHQLGKTAVRVVGGFSEQANQELLDYYTANIPNEFEQATQSSGNLHNPTLAPLKRHFPDAFRSTSLYQQIHYLMAKKGYSTATISFEKYWLTPQTNPPHVIVLDIWLMFERPTNLN